MKSTTKSIIFITLFFVFVVIYLYFSNGLSNSFEYIKLNNYTSEPIEENINTGKYIPTNWTGIPISYDNPMFIDPEENMSLYITSRDLLKQEILLMSEEDFDNNDNLWEDLVSKYENIIGWNGIIDALDNAVEIKNSIFKTSHRMHTLGEILMMHASSSKHAVEVSSRVIDGYRKAILHGAVWKAIENIGVSDLSKFHDTADELCGFKYDQDVGNIWISCVHGIGHGLSYILGMDGISQAIDICNTFEDSQFQFACATGIYMALEPDENRRSFHPCDTNKFPGACYRFKTRLFAGLFYNETYPCRTQTDDYHKVGCVWGHAYTSPNILFTNYYSFCERYIPSNDDEIEAIIHAACIDGIFSGRESAYVSTTDLQNMCLDLNEYPLSKKQCDYRKDSKEFRKFTFTKDKEYYPISILEKIRQGDGKTTPAEWLTQWNKIPIKPVTHN